jgi:hypothetical protein
MSAKRISNFYDQTSQILTTNFAGAIEKEDDPDLNQFEPEARMGSMMEQ